jgi:hypothetical protein
VLRRTNTTITILSSRQQPFTSFVSLSANSPNRNREQKRRPFAQSTQFSQLPGAYMADKRTPGVRHLDYAIGAVASLIAFFVILWPFRDLEHDTWDFSGISRGINMELLIFIGLVVGIPLYFFYRKGKKINDAKALALTPEHSFRVKVTVDAIANNPALLTAVRGRPVTHSLKVDVTISPKDWDRIKKTGFYDAVLFKYPDTTSTTSREVNSYRVNYLETVGSVDFFNIGQAEDAKEELLQSLVNLKSAIERIKEGKQVTEFEL